MKNINDRPRNGRSRIRFGLGFTLIGLVIFLLGADPAIFNLDRSPVFGFVQISVFLIGLALICLGGYISLASLWNNKQKTIVAELGQRLVSTGYVIAVVSGMADVFGLGSHPFPQVPYFGPWQAIGVISGVVMIGLGFILFLPRQLPSEGDVGKPGTPPKPKMTVDGI
jgi:hypothetical protein